MMSSGLVNTRSGERIAPSWLATSTGGFMRARYPASRRAPRENSSFGITFAKIFTALAKAGLFRLSSATSYMIRRLSAVALAATLCLAPAAMAAPLAADEMIKLPCGHSIKVLSVSRIEYSKGVMAVMVRYQTSLSPDQRKALSEEVDDVFKVTQKQVERDGFHEAIISSNQVVKGIILTSNRTMNFIFERGTDGTWTRIGRSEFMAVQ